MPPIDPTTLVIYLAVAALGWFVRHRNILPLPKPNEPTPAPDPSPAPDLLRTILDELRKLFAEKQQKDIETTKAKIIAALKEDDK